MSKRRISKQQSVRIQKMQNDFLNSSDAENLIDGLVISRFSRHAEIEDSQGKQFHCSIRPNIDSLVAGDRVVWLPEGTSQGVVVSRHPRQSVLGRPHKKGEMKPVAANITQVIIVVAPKPELAWSLLDSYLVMIEHLNLQVCIVLNKTDLESDSIQKELLSGYKKLGYSILFTSKKNNIGQDDLKQLLNHHTSVFVGQSGVGKSSLINGVLPHETIQTGALSTGSELGCHTTSNSRYYHIQTGGAIIDSPGVRELGLWHMPVSDILQGFREFRSLIHQCKFRNCNHKDSPGCAILDSLHKDIFTQKRYESFIKLSMQFAR